MCIFVRNKGNDDLRVTQKNLKNKDLYDASQ